MSHYQTQKVTPHMVSKGGGVYHMPNQNTSIGRCPDDARFWHNGRLRTLAAVPGDFSYPNLRLSNIIVFMSGAIAAQGVVTQS